VSFFQAPKIQDRLLCSVLYTGVFIPFITWMPLIWLIIINLRKEYVKDFVKYHCYQAILFNMIVFFLPQLLNLLVDFVSNILSLVSIFDNSVFLLKNICSWLIKVYYLLIELVAVYAIIWTARSKFTYIPPISQAVNLLLR
jgi:hypothetical protein